MATERLLAAQARLDALRKQHTERTRPEGRKTAVSARLSAAEAPSLSASPLARGQAALAHRRQQAGLGLVGEGEAAKAPFTLTAVNPARSATSSRAEAVVASKPSGGVKLYPDIGLGMLRQELTAVGRLWLLLRYLDENGCGKLRIDIIKQQLTNKTSALRLCGPRQLRNLLRDGEGVYWSRDGNYIWYRSAAKVAGALGVARLTGRPVALPLAALLNGVGDFRAHLYAAFHSGRIKETAAGDAEKPIARDTLAGLSGVGRSSQRNYEQRVGLDVQTNFAVGELATKENEEQRVWEKGTAVFTLKDYRGQQGKKGKTYLAWQLPNSYGRRHRSRPKGRQRRINRELKDLVMKGMPGNVDGASETPQPTQKRYYPNGKLAARAYGRDPAQERYWQRGGRHRGNGRFTLWQQLGGG